MKNILLGNGLNIANDNKFLFIYDIKKRFLDNLKDEIQTIEELLDITNLNYQTIELIVNDETGIEQISGAVFNYLYKLLEEKNAMCWNYCYRIIEILSAISLKSIFLVDGKFKEPKIEDKYIKKICKYRKIFTLNYIETWDKNRKCNYLHGNIREYFNNYEGQYITTNILDSNSFINAKAEYKILLDLKEIIFIPDNRIVDKYVYVGEGLYFNKCGLTVYPADDLFPYGGKGDIYSKINDVDSLDIFGVSPYGDKSLINKISNINDVKIYVYDIENNKKEVEEWKKYLPKATYVDSSKFLED